jgi:hypothetical protein
METDYTQLMPPPDLNFYENRHLTKHETPDDLVIDLLCHFDLLECIP